MLISSMLKVGLSIGPSSIGPMMSKLGPWLIYHDQAQARPEKKIDNMSKLSPYYSTGFGPSSGCPRTSRNGTSTYQILKKLLVQILKMPSRASAQQIMAYWFWPSSISQWPFIYITRVKKGDNKNVQQKLLPGHDICCITNMRNSLHVTLF